MNTLYIGLGHKARQGKNIVADVLKTAGGDKVKLYALADELKMYCRDNHNKLTAQYPYVDLSNPKDDPIYGYTKMLQFIGTDVIRKENPNYWVEVLEKRIEAEKPAIAVVTDVRFPNEANWIHGKGGALVKVARFMPDGTQYRDPNRDPNHPSECSLDDYNDWDFVIMAADGELAALKESASQLWSMLNEEDASPVAAVFDPRQLDAQLVDEIEWPSELVR